MGSSPPDWGIVQFFQDITGWFNWTAISAVFAFLALLNTARIADRSSRQQRERDAVFLDATAELVEGAVEPARCLLDKLREDADVIRAAQVAIYIEENSDLISEATSIDEKSFPSVESLKAYLKAKINLKIIHSEIKKISAYKAKKDWPESEKSFLKEKIFAVEAAVKTLATEGRRVNRRSMKDLKFEQHTDCGRYGGPAA